MKRYKPQINFPFGLINYLQNFPLQLIFFLFVKNDP